MDKKNDCCFPENRRYPSRRFLAPGFVTGKNSLYRERDRDECLS